MDPYAGGRLESSGTFTVDLERLANKLGRAQLRSVEQAVLRFLAAAVRGGATWFRYESRPKGYACEWDAAAGELDPMSELAIGLHTVRARKGQVTVTAGVTTRVEVRLPWRPFWRSETKVLEARGSLAPLQVHGFERVTHHLGGNLVERIGNPHFGRDPESQPGGRGGFLRRVKRGKEELCFVIDGVSYTRSYEIVPTISICWWTDELTPDLAREKVVESTEWHRLCDELEQEALAFVLAGFSPANDPERLGSWLAAQAFGDLQASLEDVPLFLLADGSYSTPAHLRAQFARDGYLGVSKVKFEPDTSFPGGEMVLDSSSFNAVKQHFPHLLEVSHLHNARKVPRLPADQPYLTRIPLSHTYGEVGLRLGPHEGVQRRTDGSGTWQWEQPSAACVDVANGIDSIPRALPDLYRALRYQQRHKPQNAQLVTCYLLDCLLHMVGKLTNQQKWGKRKYTWGSWRTAEIWELVETLRIPLAGGESVSLREVGSLNFYAYNDQPPPPPTRRSCHSRPERPWHISPTPRSETTRCSAPLPSKGWRCFRKRPPLQSC